MARTSAQRSTSSVIRTYAAVDRASAERSFHREREQAAGRGWDPVSQRWRTEGQEQVLTVVYESRTGYLPAMGARDGEIAAEDPPGASEPWPDGSATGQPWVDAANAARLQLDDGVSTSWLDGALLTASAQPIPWDETAARARDAGRFVIETLDLHCAGEPLRLVRSGYPAVPAPAHRGAPCLGARARRPRAPAAHATSRAAIATCTAPSCCRRHRDRRRHRRAVHAQRGLQHDVRPRHHRAHPGPHRGGSLPGDACR